MLKGESVCQQRTASSFTDFISSFAQIADAAISWG